MVDTAGTFRSQWTEPSDIFSILLILGGDVIRLALAALAGGFITPVAFSFGWVAYAISALLSALGENRLMPTSPEISILVMNLKNKYTRNNQSWLLARALKDYEFWMSKEVREITQPQVVSSDVEGQSATLHTELSAQSGGQEASASRHVALCVAVYDWCIDSTHTPGRPALDWVWYSGLVVTMVQLGVSAVPLGLYGDWGILLVTAGGSLLAYASGSLPAWKKEKWACRHRNKDVALTRGNGSKHIIIIKGHDEGLDLEDLAGGRDHRLKGTRVVIFIISVLWLLLLITSTGIHSNSWYLLAVGGLGMIQNLFVAGMPRHPEALGLPIKLAEETDGRDPEHKTPAVFAEEKVMWTLMELELKYSGFGQPLVNEFFPGKQRDWEKEWWSSTDPQRRIELLRQQKENHREKQKQKKEQDEKQRTTTQTSTFMA